MAHCELYLEINEGPESGARYPLGAKAVTIGRDPSCVVHLDNSKVSRIHGIVEFEGGIAYYRDNGSTNGTLLNGITITAERLKPGDVLEIGPYCIGLIKVEEPTNITMMPSEAEVTMMIPASEGNADTLARLASDWEQNRSAKESTSDSKSARIAKGLGTLFRLTNAMSREPSRHSIVKTLSDGVFEVLNAERFILLLTDPMDGSLAPKLCRDREGNEELRLGISSSILKIAREHRSTVVANDALNDERFNSSASIANLELKAVMCSPLIVGEDFIGALYLDNRIGHVAYDDLDAKMLTALANQAAVALNNARLTENLQRSYQESLQTLVRLIEIKDEYTVGHTQRVKQYSLGLATELGFTSQHLERLALAAELHDIGKIFIDDMIINKPGGLTDPEYENIKEHVLKGVQALDQLPSLADIVPWIRGHHERWDGSGYPDGLAGEDCPLEARILAMADAFDAMTSQRSYNKPFTFIEAIGRIEQASGKHFDPKLVKAFGKYIRQCTTSHHESNVEDDDPTPSPESGGTSTTPGDTDAPLKPSHPSPKTEPPTPSIAAPQMPQMPRPR